MSQVRSAEGEDGFMPFVQAFSSAGDYLEREDPTSFLRRRIEEKVADNTSVDEFSFVVFKFREGRLFRRQDDIAVRAESNRGRTLNKQMFNVWSRR